MDECITFYELNWGIGVYMGWTTVAFLLITLVLEWRNEKYVKKMIGEVEEKFRETDKHLIGGMANNHKVVAMIMKQNGNFDWAFLREINAANLYSKIKVFPPANSSLFSADDCLEKIDNISRLLLSYDTSSVDEIFMWIEEMKKMGDVNQPLLRKIENDFKIKYENSIKN